MPLLVDWPLHSSKVFQGYHFRYQLKAHIQLRISE